MVEQTLHSTHTEGTVRNAGGGFSFPVDHWTQAQRFLILGTEGGTYYTDEHTLTRQNAKSLETCIKQDGIRLVQMIREVSSSGRAPKNDPALFALAMCAKLGNEKTQHAAYSALNDVARIGTHLEHFVSYLEIFGGSGGNGTKRAIQRWFTQKTDSQLALQAVKYAQRDGWSMADILRLSHPHPSQHGGALSDVMDYIVDGAPSDISKLPLVIQGTEEIKKVKNPTQAAKMITKYNLPREVVPTELLTSPEVWEALLENMPMTAMIRNLATMTRVGLLSTGSDHTKKIVETLHNENLLRNARIHPMQILIALRTYDAGHGVRGTNTWTPVQKITSALDNAFYLCFQNVQPTGKRTLLSLDVSGSMDGAYSYLTGSGGGVAGVPGFTPREASTAMALVTLRTEPYVEVMGFSSSFIPLKIDSSMRLDEAMKVTRGLPFSGTDCSLPFVWAQKNQKDFDAFVVYTDNETNIGSSPSLELKNYRKDRQIAAKSVVVAMTSGGFTIADPKDAGMLDVVGFDSAAPAVMADFFRDSHMVEVNYGLK